MSARPSAPVAWSKARACSRDDAVEFLRGSSIGRADALADPVLVVARQAVGGAQHLPLGFEHGSRGVARGRAVRPRRQGRTTSGGRRPSRRIAPRSSLALDLLGEGALEVACREGRALLGHQLEHGAGVALVDRVAQLVRFLAAGANDAAAMVALVLLGPSRQLEVVRP